MGTTSVDPQALRLAAHRLDAAADLLDAAIGAHLRPMHHVIGVHRVTADVAEWQRAARDGAVGLRAVADGFSAQDCLGAKALR